MAVQDKSNENSDCWNRNTEKHSHIEVQLATIAAQVDGLTRRVEKLEDGQINVRTELKGQIENVRIEFNSRIDLILGLIENVRAELKGRTGKNGERIDETNLKLGELSARLLELSRLLEENIKRQDDLRSYMDNQFSMFRAEVKAEREEFRNDLRWMVVTYFVIVGLMLIIATIYLLPQNFGE